MAEISNGRRLIFVGGAPRSGTTLLQNMLDSHPDICGGPEFLHIPDIINLRKKLHLSISRRYIDFFCSYEEVDRHITSWIQDLLLPLADKEQCRLLSEKTPQNILVFSELMELFPQAKFIHVIRDPRAIVSSMRKVGTRAKNKGLKPPSFAASITAGITYVKKCFDAGFTATRTKIGAVLTVVYERLVEDPATETKRICDFLELEWSDQMISPGEKKHLGEKAITSMSNEVWYNTTMYYRNPDSRNIEKWKNQLTLARQVQITTAFEDYEELKQFGYDFSIDSLVPTKCILGLNYALFFHLGQKLYKYLSPLIRRIPGIGRIKRALFN
jgi:hypothetical protein